MLCALASPQDLSSAKKTGSQQSTDVSESYQRAALAIKQADIQNCSPERSHGFLHQTLAGADSVRPQCLYSQYPISMQESAIGFAFMTDWVVS